MKQKILKTINSTFAYIIGVRYLKCRDKANKAMKYLVCEETEDSENRAIWVDSYGENHIQVSSDINNASRWPMSDKKIVMKIIKKLKTEKDIEVTLLTLGTTTNVSI